MRTIFFTGWIMLRALVVLSFGLSVAHAQYPTYTITGMGPTQTSPTLISEIVYQGTYDATSALMLQENHFRVTNAATASKSFENFQTVTQGGSGFSPAVTSTGDRLFFTGTGGTRVRLTYEWSFQAFISSNLPATWDEGRETRVTASGYVSYSLRDAEQAAVPYSSHYITFTRTERLDGQVDNFGVFDNYNPLVGQDPFLYTVEFDLLEGYSIDLSFQLYQTANAYAELATRAGMPNTGNYTSASGTTNLIVRVENIGAAMGALTGGNGFDYALTAVPEPSTYALIGGGFALGLAIWRRNRR
jgi:hypothetical protein